jgi:protein O-mannosyl-transferase
MRSARRRRPGGEARGGGPCAGRESSGPLTRRTRLLASAAVALFAFLLYVPGFSNGFAYDAEAAVEHDARIQNLEQPGRLLVASYWGFDEERLALYRPFVTLSFAVDWAIHGGKPWGFHQTNALAHALVSSLVFLLLAGFASLPAALAGAAVFAAHPVHVEAVANIVGRADIFSAGFIFAAMMAWSRLAPRGAAVVITVPFLFLLALGSKESAVMLPALLVLLDAATGRLRRAGLREWLRDRAVPVLALALVAVGYLAVRMAVLGTMAPESVNPVMAAAQPGLPRLLTALQIWPEILRLLVFPLSLLADYGPRILVPAEGLTPRALGGLVILGGSVAGGVVALLRGRGRLGLALLWAPVALFPVSNLVVPIGVLLAERTLYIAVFPVVLGVAAALDWAGGNGRRMLHGSLAMAALVCALFAARTVLRLPAWKSTDQVFRTLARDRPDSYRAQWHFARMAWRDRDLEEAARRYRATMDLWPHAPPVYAEAGMFATEEGLEREARAFAELALEQWPGDPAFLRRLAVACLNLNDTAAARGAVERGLGVVSDAPLFLAMWAATGGARSR